MGKDDLPAYEQVKAWIRGHIASGDWKPGDPVPSEAALMARFGISRMTAHRALRELATEGLVTRTQGSGTRVTSPSAASSRSARFTVIRLMANRSISAVSLGTPSPGFHAPLAMWPRIQAFTCS